MGAVGAGAGLLFHSKKKPREAKIAGGGGAALILVAAILFLTRPDAHAELSDLGEDAVPAPGKASTFTGANFLSTTEPERTRPPVPSPNHVPFNFARGGSFNAPPNTRREPDGDRTPTRLDRT